MSSTSLPDNWSTLPQAVKDAVLRQLQQRYREQGGATALPPLVALEPGRRLPASMEQQYLWQRQRLHGFSLAWTIAVTPMFFERVDPQALEGALLQLQRQHDSLRTRFEVDGEDLYQVVDAEADLPLRRQKLSRLRGRAATIEAIGRHQQAMVDEPFDMHTGPLWRALLLQRGRDAVLLLSVCNLIFDGPSLALVQQQLHALYAHQRGDAGALAQPSRGDFQYADYAQWQDGMREHTLWRERLQWWREQLAGEVPLVEGEGGEPAGIAARLHTQVLSAETGARLDAYAQRHETTAFVVMLTEFMAALVELDGHRDVWVAAPSAGRPLAGTEQMLGNFMRQVILRQRWPERGDPLGEVHRTVSEGLEQGELPHLLVHQLLADRAGGFPFRYFFNYRQVEAGPGESLPETDCEYESPVEQRLQDREEQILLVVNQTGSSRALNWYLRDSRFHGERSRVLLRSYYRRLLERIADVE